MAGKIAVVVGATGAQGGGAVRAFQSAGYTVRAVTRNPAGEKALALQKQGCELVKADIDNLDELTAAFTGANTIWAMTNFIELLFALGDSDAAGEREAQQGWNMARAAAAQRDTLEHYFWSTLPNARRVTAGKFPVPHFDYKAAVDERIQAELPQLAAVTTYVWVAWYVANFVGFPIFKPVPVPGSDKRVFMLPSPSNAVHSIVGDVSHHVSVFLSAALKRPEQIKTKYIEVLSDRITTGQVMDALNDVTGQNAMYVDVPREVFAGLWGLIGAEMNWHFAFAAHVPNWSQGMEDRVLTPKDIDVPKDQIISVRDSFAAVKEGLMER